MSRKIGLEAIVVGSGFGGAVTTCRLAKKWPGKVMVIERGRRYPMGTFPRNPHAMAQNFFNVPTENARRPKHIPRKKTMTGLFDIRSFDHMDVVTAAGVGGGSLIYANVFMEPPANVFDERWPSGCKAPDLAPYYAVAKDVLGARPIPTGHDPRRLIKRTQYFQKVAAQMNRSSQLVDLNVFFGNDFDHPLPLGEQARNRYGALQSSCNYCAECDLGCNIHAKNTLDLNYLHVAETRYGAVIASEQKVYRIAALDALGEENSAMHGEHGYAVSVYNIRTGETKVWHAKRVIMAAGTLNTNELLLQARDRDLTLPHLSAALGQSFSGNGDFLAFVMNGQDPVDPNYGPVITQRIDFNLFDQQQPEHAFIMEDAAYPAMVAWYLEGQKPLFMKWGAISAFLHRIWDGVRRRQGVHHSGRFLAELFRFDMSYRSSVHLCMGLDRSDGVMSLDERRALSLHWPYQNSMSLYEAIIRSVKEFGRWSQGESSFALPTWYLKRNVSVHPLGGCRVGESPETSVTAATPASFGQVHNYQNLYVADGSLLPTAVGANPSATIAAMAERVAEGLTGIKPDANL